MRWLIALIVSFAVIGTANAGVFKPRKPGGKKAVDKPAEKAPIAEKAPTPTPVAKKAAPVAVKKSAVVTKARPDDLTPKPKKKKKGDVVITEDKEEDVIVKDDD